MCAKINENKNWLHLCSENLRNRSRKLLHTLTKCYKQQSLVFKYIEPLQPFHPALS